MSTTVLVILAAAVLGASAVLYAIARSSGWLARKPKTTNMGSSATLAERAEDLSDEFRAPETEARPPFRLPLGFFTSRKMGGRPGSLLLGERDLPVLVIGAIKSGKTSGYVVPGILEWGPGPVISTSVKADVLTATVVQRLAIAQRHGGRVVIFDPSGVLDGPAGDVRTPAGPLRSLVAPWTPLSHIRSWEDAAKSADLMVFSYAGGRRGGSDNAQFFNQQAGSVLAALLFFFSQTQNATMRDVVKAVADFQRDASTATSGDDAIKARTVSERVIEDLGEARRLASTYRQHLESRQDQASPEHQKELARARMREADWEQAEDRLRIVKDLMRTAPATFGSIIATLDGLLSVYRNRHELGWQQHDDPRTIDPQLLVSSASTLYVVAPATEAQRYSALISALVGRTLESARLFAATIPGERLPADLLASLDELTNTAPLQDLEQYVATARAHGITFELAVQSWSQLVERYGEDSAATILSNSGTVVVLPRTKDRKTLEYMSLLLGEAKLETRSTTTTMSWSEGADGDRKSKTKQGGSSETVAHEWRPIATPERIASMKDGEALLKIGADSAQALQRRAHEEPSLIRLAQGSTTQVEAVEAITDPHSLSVAGVETVGLADAIYQPVPYTSPTSAAPAFPQEEASGYGMPPAPDSVPGFQAPVASGNSSLTSEQAIEMVRQQEAERAKWTGRSAGGFGSPKPRNN